MFLWRELVTIDRDVPIELDLRAGRLDDYDRGEVLRLFREYEFRTLVERLPAVSGEEARAPGELLREADRSAPVPAAVVAGRPSAAERAAAGGGGMQLSLDFGAHKSAGNGHQPPPASADSSAGHERARLPRRNPGRSITCE